MENLREPEPDGPAELQLPVQRSVEYDAGLAVRRERIQPHGQLQRRPPQRIQPRDIRRLPRQTGQGRPDDHAQRQFPLFGQREQRHFLLQPTGQPSRPPCHRSRDRRMDSGRLRAVALPARYGAFAQPYPARRVHLHGTGGQIRAGELPVPRHLRPSGARQALLRNGQRLLDRRTDARSAVVERLREQLHHASLRSGIPLFEGAQHVHRERLLPALVARRHGDAERFGEDPPQLQRRDLLHDGPAQHQS